MSDSPKSAEAPLPPLPDPAIEQIVLADGSTDVQQIPWRYVYNRMPDPFFSFVHGKPMQLEAHEVRMVPEPVAMLLHSHIIRGTAKRTVNGDIKFEHKVELDGREQFRVPFTGEEGPELFGPELDNYVERPGRDGLQTHRVLLRR